MIRGYVASSSPFVPVHVSFQSISTRPRELQFLLDTGAAVSVLHPADTTSIGIDPNADLAGVLETNVGVGGEATFYRLMSRLEFTQHDGTRTEYRFAMRIAKPTDANATMPSILGMDFIQHFRLTVSVREDWVVLESLFDEA